MAALSGKLVSKTEIKSNGNVIHRLLSDESHRIPSLSPEKIQGVELVEGVWGTQGSILCWKYVIDGKAETCTEMIEEINEENKSIRFKVVAGDVLKQYKAYTYTCKVDQLNDNTYIVTWTIEYEKQHEAVPPPNALMGFCIHLIKDIENRYQQLKPQ